MKFQRNYDAFDEQEGFSSILPEDDYMLEIVSIEDGYTKKNNDYMANVTFRVIDEGKYYNSLIWDNIIFPEPDSPANKIIGRTKRFLHSINEPYAGDFDVDTDNWIGKTVKVHTGIDEWDGKKKTTIAKYLLDDNSKKENKKSRSKPKINDTPIKTNKNISIDGDDDDDDEKMPWD